MRVATGPVEIVATTETTISEIATTSVGASLLVLPEGFARQVINDAASTTPEADVAGKWRKLPRESSTS